MKLSGTVLVTGGCGFIGSNFIRYLLDKTDFSGDIINLDKLTYAGHLENVTDIQLNYSDRYHFIRGDIADRNVVANIFHEFQIRTVAHFAAESHVDRSITGSAPFMETNILGTWTLLEAARNAWGNHADPEQFRFHHVSTDEVFGQLGPDDPAFCESTPYDPRSPYSASKASSDHLVRAWQHTYGLPVTISNCSNNYGPYQYPEKLIPVVILNAMAGKPIPVYGDGGNIRDWLFVEDHCEALWRILESGVPGETYNIGGNCEVKNIDLVHTICDILDEVRPLSRSVSVSASARKNEEPEPISDLSEHRTQNTEHLPSATHPPSTITHQSSPITSYTDLISFVTDRPGHDRRYAMDTDKIRQALEWTAGTEFRNGLTRTIRWYFENRKWIDAVQK